MTVLKSGLLDGRSIALAGVLPADVSRRLSNLGARLVVLEETDEDRALEWAREAAPIDALVCGSDTVASIDRSWVAVRALANGALIPASGGAIILLAPRLDAAVHAEAVRAALENLARTLSVEWARYGITATAVTPGTNTSDDDLATLIAFLCSEAGAYYSGCRFELNVLR
jgi:hypothetical protein